MRSVLFTFSPQVSRERQEALLAQIGTWQGVKKVARLKPDAQHPEIWRMCYADIEDGADIEAMVERLAALPEVESAASPAERHLL
jgi:hypothetical protein